LVKQNIYTFYFKIILKSYRTLSIFSVKKKHYINRFALKNISLTGQLGISLANKERKRTGSAAGQEKRIGGRFSRRSSHRSRLCSGDKFNQRSTEQIGKEVAQLGEINSRLEIIARRLERRRLIHVLRRNDIKWRRIVFIAFERCTRDHRRFDPVEKGKIE
jgi:hypothetical protein